MNATVVVADDSLTVRMDLQEVLRSVGFDVVTCSTIAETKQQLSSGLASLLVLDVLFPDGDGLELLRAIRADGALASLPVFLLSSDAEVGHRLAGLRIGADEYIGKPYDRAYLAARAHEVLGDRVRGPILVIDDSATFRNALSAALRAAGYSVVACESGEVGLGIAASARPSLMIVDGELPGIDGRTVIRRTRLDPALRDTPCLLLTGADATGSEEEALDAGADGFVRKEPSFDLLLGRVATLVRSPTRGPHGSGSALGPKRVLAVDDSPTYLHELGLALQSEGYEVARASSGEEALELLAHQPVDCVLLDLMMPGLGGEETCARIKGSPTLRDTPVVILTALEDRETMLQVLQAGADDYISKSAELSVLRARVRAQLRRHQFEAEVRRSRERVLRAEREAVEARASRVLAETKAALVDELERKNKELEAFSYSVSHDLRAPLRSIREFSQGLIEDYHDLLPPQGQDYLERIRRASQRMGELIDDLLALSQVSSAELHRADIDLAQIARLVAADLGTSAPRAAPVELVVAPALPARADARLMRVVLENLLGNAWKFTAMVTAPKVEVGAMQQDATRWFFVRDNGAGFDAANSARLFRPFQRLHSVSEYPGTGIGLATVQRVVERHGGAVRAVGELGVGATIFFSLPAASEVVDDL